MNNLNQSQSDHHELPRAHVWGCPVFVLETNVQNDKKLLKWNRISLIGQFLGSLAEH